MRKVEIADLWIIQSASEPGNWKEIRELVEDYYQKDLAHGDLRQENLIFAKDTPYKMLPVDLDREESLFCKEGDRHFDELSCAAWGRGMNQHKFSHDQLIFLQQANCMRYTSLIWHQVGSECPGRGLAM